MASSVGRWSIHLRPVNLGGRAQLGGRTWLNWVRGVFTDILQASDG